MSEDVTDITIRLACVFVPLLVHAERQSLKIALPSLLIYFKCCTLTGLGLGVEPHGPGVGLLMAKQRRWPRVGPSKNRVCLFTGDYCREFCQF